MKGRYYTHTHTHTHTLPGVLNVARDTFQKKKRRVRNHKSKGTKKRNNDVFLGHSRELRPSRKHVGGV